MQPLRAIRKQIELIVFITASSILLYGCGGGGGGGSTATTPTPTPTPTPTSHVVNISWAANREAEVNKAGGGYIVAISGQPPVTLPFASTTMSTTLLSGNYSVSVSAYSALASSVTGSTSAPSVFSFSVPY